MPTKAAYGQTITLSWDVDNAKRIVMSHYLQKGKEEGEEVNDPGEERAKVGTVQVKPEYPTTVYTIEVRGGNGQHDKRSVRVDVAAPPIPPPAKMKSFEANPTRIHAGDPVQLSWMRTNYTRRSLIPATTSSARSSVP